MPVLVRYEGSMEWGGRATPKDRVRNGSRIERVIEGSNTKRETERGRQWRGKAVFPSDSYLTRKGSFRSPKVRGGSRERVWEGYAGEMSRERFAGRADMFHEVNYQNGQTRSKEERGRRWRGKEVFPSLPAVIWRKKGKKGYTDSIVSLLWVHRKESRKTVTVIDNILMSSSKLPTFRFWRHRWTSARDRHTFRSILQHVVEEHKIQLIARGVVDLSVMTGIHGYPDRRWTIRGYRTDGPMTVTIHYRRHASNDVYWYNDLKFPGWACNRRDAVFFNVKNHLIDKSNPSSEVAVFKQGERIPISERLETEQDRPEQRWVPPILSINVGDTQSELFHLVLVTFVYYAKIKIEAMGGFASIQSTGTYSAGISGVNERRLTAPPILTFSFVKL
ncbi:hypothetical protein K435DRAFT_899427 [Dendrothele bispora CBS 962.96]|uniref:Uncharacterized protein n=1 Tax=Dendrothele bispora (strain CBS 962.96) TaxID=1314807 RepID=A0A4S8LY68_DENBC|nr:hypothetical protein K435DRAFT_899427 [Dendrothele bispora CBS 962.96]